MPNISPADAQAWFERTKHTVTTIDSALESQIASEVAARVPVEIGSTPETTPALVRSIIAMKYAAAYYNRVYSDEQGTSEYSDELEARAGRLLDGVISGQLVVEPNIRSQGSFPSYYPSEDIEPRFTMGKVF